MRRSVMHVPGKITLALLCVALVALSCKSDDRRSSPPTSSSLVRSQHSALTLTTAQLLTARSHHTSTLLPSGKILIAGGTDTASNVVSSAELYDPMTGIVSSAGSMASARTDHTATLLTTGEVLIAGGSLPNGARAASAELYDPIAGTFAALPDMAVGHAVHTATLLADGRVFIVGGVADQKGISAEIYHPDAKTFTAGGTPKNNRSHHTATRLVSGDVLIVGGVTNDQGNPASPIAELWSPTTPISATTDPFSIPVLDTGVFTARSDHTATLYPDGMVLLAGGGGGIEVYDPLQNEVSMVAPTPRVGHAAVLLPTNDVLLAGGSDPTTEAILFDQHLVQPLDALQDNRTFFTATLLPSGDVVFIGGLALGSRAAVPSIEILRLISTDSLKKDSGKLAAGVLGGRLTPLLDGHVVASGGTAPPSTGLDTFDPTTNSFTAHHDMTVGRTAHSATLLDNGNVLLAGGFADVTLIPLDSAEIFNGTKSTLIAKLVTARATHAAVRLRTGKILIVGGTTPATQTSELFDPVTSTFTASATMTTFREAPIALLLPNGQVLVAGGEDQNSGSLKSAETYDPESKTFTAAASDMTMPRARSAATLLPSGKVLFAGGDGAGSTAELYDPESRSFTATKGAMGIPRIAPTMTLLASGRVVVLGGASGDPSGAVDEVYDPVLDSFSRVPGDSIGLSDHQAILLSSSSVLVVGGAPQTSFLGTEGWTLWTELPASDATRAPKIDAFKVHASSPGSSAITGVAFTSAFEASGSSTSSSATNSPIALWMPFSGGLVTGGLAPWSTTSATWTLSTTLTGPGLLFGATSGVVGVAQPIVVDRALPGVPCKVDVDCASDHCVDGVCCNNACTDFCMACSLPASKGTCSPAPPGVDPHSQCALEDVSTCGRSGGCNGAGACATYADGTSCNTGSACTKGACTPVPPTTCDARACGSFTCRDSACLTRCTSTSDCAPGLQCAADGSCNTTSDNDVSAPSCVCTTSTRRTDKSGSTTLLIVAAALALGVRRVRRVRRRHQFAAGCAR